MNIAKVLAAASLLAAPVVSSSAQSAQSAQSSQPPDSGSRARAAWLSGAATAAGAGLFLAFTQSGRGSPGSALNPHFMGFTADPAMPTRPPAPPVPSPAGGSKTGTQDGAGPTSSGPGTDPSQPGATKPDSSPTKPDSAPTPPSSDATPPSTDSVVPPLAPPDPPVLFDAPPPQDPKSPAGPTDGPLFVNETGDTSPGNDYPILLEAPSTVPEPGSLALTATGIIGLVPLIRRRR